MPSGNTPKVPLTKSAATRLMRQERERQAPGTTAAPKAKVTFVEGSTPARQRQAAEMASPAIVVTPATKRRATSVDAGAPNW
eukprot:4501928-Heterocapsa_arctica.AAC.1